MLIDWCWCCVGAVLVLCWCCVGVALQWCGESATIPSTTAACSYGSSRTTDVLSVSRSGSCRDLEAKSISTVLNVSFLKVLIPDLHNSCV